MRHDLARMRLLIIFSLGWLLATIEMIVHYEPGNPRFFTPDMWHRLPVYALAFPLATWVLLELLERSNRAPAEAAHELERHKGINRALLNSLEYQHLLDAIVYYPKTIAPAIGASLLLYSEEEAAFKHANAWRPADGTEPGVTVAPIPDVSSSCPVPQALHNGDIVLCPSPDGLQPCRPYVRYCAPLISQERLTGLLYIDLPDGTALSARQLETLRLTLPEMALALDYARSRNASPLQVDPALSERHQLARDLHDTLAQDIGYLRLKLDQFTKTIDTIGKSEFRQDVEHMRDAANDAYEHIRDALASLRVSEQGDLVSLLRDRAQLVSDRSGIDVQVVSVGEPAPLTSKVKHEVLSITREALNNVERHAKAQLSLIQLTWRADELKLAVEDDGAGFDPDSVQSMDHLGLSVMCQRARAIGGKVTIKSAPGGGTRVLLWLPIR